MKRHDQDTDEFFREILKDHTITPSEESRKAFLTDVAKLPIKKKRGIPPLALIVTIMFIAIVSVVIVLNNKPALQQLSEGIQQESATTGVVESGSAGNNKNIPTAPQAQGKSANEYVNPEKSGYLPTEATAGYFRKKATPTPKINNTTTSSKDSANKVSPAILTEEPQPVSGISGEAVTLSSDQSDQALAGRSVTSQTDKVIRDSVLIQPVVPDKSADISTPDSVTVFNPAKSISAEAAPPRLPEAGTAAEEKQRRNQYDYKNAPPDKGNLRIGISYTPEWIFNTIEKTNFSNNFGADLTFRAGQYSIRTGAGLSISKGTNELTVSYNDFLGSYNKLDSMDFSWSDPAHNYIPTYYMSRMNVWDSLLKLDYPKVVKRYTYLQIPLIFGYDFMRIGRWSLGVRVGPLLSVLLQTKQLSDDYNPVNKKVVSINNLPPEQINLNWQVLAGINANFNIRSRLNIEIEPFVKYYFNSVYEKPETGFKPWSAGIRTAISFDL